MGELTDDHHHDDEIGYHRTIDKEAITSRRVDSLWEAGAQAAVRKDWEADVQAAHDENIRELEQREHYAVETDRHACADEESEIDSLRLGKLSPREAVLLIKNIYSVESINGGDYYADYLMQVREIIRRLDMKA